MMFQGFTKETAHYFLEAGRHNSKAFFEQNRAVYQERVGIPLRELNEELAACLYELDKELCFVPGRCISTPYADARFCGGRPLKEYMYLHFKLPRERGRDIPCFFFDAGSADVRYGLRIVKQTASGMERVRNATLEALPRVSGALMEAGRQGLTPRGRAFQKDRYPEFSGALGEWLNQRELLLAAELPLPPDFTGAAFAGRLKSAYQSLAPLYTLAKDALDCPPPLA